MRLTSSSELQREVEIERDEQQGSKVPSKMEKKALLAIHLGALNVTEVGIESKVPTTGPNKHLLQAQERFREAADYMDHFIVPILLSPFISKASKSPGGSRGVHEKDGGHFLRIGCSNEAEEMENEY